MKRIQTILFLLVPLLSCCRAVQDKKEPEEKQEAVLTSQKVRVTSMGFYGRTIDVIIWDGVEYMCSESPLSQFENYQTLFGAISSTASDPESPVDLDKNYKAKWIIKDSNLYLYDVEILYGAENFPVKRKHLEELTEHTFKKEQNIFSEYPDGVMAASWFSDRIYLKRKPVQGESYCDCMYDCEPFKELNFKDGKIATEKDVLLMTFTIDSLEIIHNSCEYRKQPLETGYIRLNQCTSNFNKEYSIDDWKATPGFFCATNDDVTWDGKKFIIDEPLLSFFSNFKKIYPNIPTYEYEMDSPEFHEKNYMAKWTIVNDRLYLYDIDFEGLHNGTKKDKELIKGEYPIRFQAVEQLTGKKFQYVPSLNKEAVFADWFSGLLYMKRYPEEGECYWCCEYKCEPFLKFIVENGKIVSKETTTYMLFKRDTE